MNLPYGAILLASVLQFIFGAVWYSLLFGKLWGKIHGFDKLSKEVQQAMMKEMGPYYLLQFIITIITTVVLALFVKALPEGWNVFAMAALLWLGFVLPTQISSVIFGGTERKWIVKKVAVQAGSALICLEIATAVLYFL